VGRLIRLIRLKHTQKRKRRKNTMKVGEKGQRANRCIMEVEHPIGTGEIRGKLTCCWVSSVWRGTVGVGDGERRGAKDGQWWKGGGVMRTPQRRKA